MGLLSVVRKHDYIQRSPAHSRAFVLSARGVVELHTKGLADFEPLGELNETMTKYSMATKLPLFAKFREYKTFRRWDFALRRRKFKERQRVAEKQMLQARHEHWACLQYAMSECVQLTEDVQEMALRASTTGWTLEQIKGEIERRRVILQDALENTRSKISLFVEKFCSGVSDRISIGKVRDIFKANRRHDPQKAIQIATDDMNLLARLYCLCEHIVCQTAIKLYNNEVVRICQLLDMTGVLNIDASMHVMTPSEVTIDLPHSQEAQTNPRNLPEMAIIPSGPHILDVITQSFNTLFSSLSGSMRPRLLSDLENHIAADVFLPYASHKPDYALILKLSVDYNAFHSDLTKKIEESHSAAVQDCYETMEHLRLMKGYMEGYAARGEEEKKSCIDNYPREAEVFAAWNIALIKFPAQEHVCRAFRLKYRRLKMQMQDTLQLQIIDERFEMFYHHTCAIINALKTSGGSFTKGLEAEILTFDDLVAMFKTYKELDECLHDFRSSFLSVSALKDVVFEQFKTTTAFSVNPEATVTLPTLNTNLSDKMKQQKRNAELRMIQQREWHVELAKGEVKRFTSDMSDIITRIRGPSVQSLSSSGDDVFAIVSDASDNLTRMQARGEVISGILDVLKLPALGLALIDETRQTLHALNALWQVVVEWRQATSQMLDTPIAVLQGIDVNARVAPVLNKVATVLQEYSKVPLAMELGTANEEFLATWPSIRRLTNPAMKPAHFDAFWRRDPKATIVYGVDTVTIRKLKHDRHLDHSELLVRLHDKAVEEAQLFGLMDKLGASGSDMALSVRREAEHIWIEGLTELASLIQDDAILISTLKASEFRKMVHVELETLTARNVDAANMVSRLQFCQDTWSAARTCSAAKHLPAVSTEVHANFESADHAWKKCLGALSLNHGGHTIRLAHIDFGMVLRVQEVEGLLTKCIQDFTPLCNYLFETCWRLRFVHNMEAMHITGMFAGPGPTVSESILVRAFPNMHAIKVNEKFRPEIITGARGETLVLEPCAKDSEPWTETLARFLPSVHKAVQLQLNLALRAINDGTLFQNLSDHTCQATVLALQVSWSTILGLAPDKLQHKHCSAEVKRHLKSLLDVFSDVSDPPLVLRSKYESLVIASHSWRDALDGMQSSLQNHQTIEMLTQVPCVQVYMFDEPTGDLVVNYGPFARKYGFEFLDGSILSPGLPTSWRYHLFLLSCLNDVSCGFIRASDCHSRKETGLHDLSRIFGVYYDSVDCHITQAVDDRLVQCVQGACQGGSWLLIKHVDHLSAERMNQLANAILTCTKALRSQTLMVNRPGLVCAASLNDGILPGIFMTGRRQIDMALPAELAVSLRTVTLPSALQHRRIVAQVQLEAAGFERAPLLAALLDCAYSILKLRLPTIEHPCLKFNHMKQVIAGAATLFAGSQSQAQAAADMNADTQLSRNHSGEQARDDQNQQTSEIESRASSLSNSESWIENSNCFNLSMRALVFAFLSHTKNLLEIQEFIHCLEAARQVFGDTGVDFAKIEEEALQHGHPNLARQTESVLSDLQQTATPEFIKRCTTLMDYLQCDTRPVMLVGAAQTGKSHCIKVVSHALGVDLSSPVKAAVPRITTKVISPIAYFSSPTGAQSGSDAEKFDEESYAKCYEYVDWFCKWPVTNDFTFSRRWLVMDCPDAGNVDRIISSAYRRQQELQMKSEDEIMPVLFVETCSVEHAAPSTLALSHLVYFDDECLQWLQIFNEWCNKLELKLETRTLQEIKDLVNTHVPEIIKYLVNECSFIQSVSWASIVRSFCCLVHYHFFLGKEVAMRRTTSFVRAVFVFAVAWSYGALLHEDCKERFDAWFRQRIEHAKLLKFPVLESEDNYTPGLWELHVSFHYMSLRSFQDTEVDFEADDYARQATDNMLLIPFQNLRMTRFLWQIFHTQCEHTLFFAPQSCGKTRFLEWIIAIQESHEKEWVYASTSLQQHRTTSQLCDWVVQAMKTPPDRMFAKPDFHGFFIDDVHLGLESAVQPTAVSELFRSMIERKGVFNKSVVEDRADLVSARFTLLGDIKRLCSANVRLLNHLILLPMMVDASNVESIAETNIQPFQDATIHPAIKNVLSRLPAAMAMMHDWVKANLAPEGTEESFLLWNIQQMFMPMSSLVLLPIWKMDTYDLCLRFIWHETMRVYCDRLADLDKVLTFRQNASECIAKGLGAQYRRSLRLASETETFHVLLPLNTSVCAAVEWDLHEVNSDDLTMRALNTIHSRESEQLRDVHGWITCIEDFPRHLSHVLRIFRPSDRIQGCLLSGPKGCGKLALLCTAAAMCNYEVFTEKPETSLEVSMLELRKALATRSMKIFVFCANGPVLNSYESAQYILRLMKGQALEKFEQAGSLVVRFAFTYDISAAIPVDLESNPPPPTLFEISKYCTVDWIKGWSDEAILRATRYRYQRMLTEVRFDPGPRVLSGESGQEDEHLYPDVLFKIHRMIEQAVADDLDVKLAMVFPAPILVNDFVSTFLHCASQRRKQIERITTELTQAVAAYQRLKVCNAEMQEEHQRLFPIVKGAVKQHLKVRENFLNYSRVAARAKQIAEDEETQGIQGVLYGDAPGPDIMQEFEAAKNAYLSASKSVAGLKAYHLTQLEMTEGFHELVQLLLEAIAIAFAQEIGNDMPNLHAVAPALQQRVAKFDPVSCVCVHKK